MSLGDKVKVTSGSKTLLGGALTNRCTGNTAPVEDINFPGLCLQDSALGVRGTDFTTVFPAGINAAATCVACRHLLCIYTHPNLVSNAHFFVLAELLWARSSSERA